MYISRSDSSILIVKLGSTSTGHDSLNVQRVSILLMHSYSSCPGVPVLPERGACVIPTYTSLLVVPSYTIPFLDVCSFLYSLSRSLCSLEASLIRCLASLDCCVACLVMLHGFLNPLDVHCNTDYNLCPDCEIFRMA
jgi:hypothetical protein